MGDWEGGGRGVEVEGGRMEVGGGRWVVADALVGGEERRGWRCRREKCAGCQSAARKACRPQVAGTLCEGGYGIGVDVPGSPGTLLLQ